MDNWVDFTAMKRSVPLAPVLRRCQVLRRSGRDQYRGRCPIHHGEGLEAGHQAQADAIPATGLHAGGKHRPGPAGHATLGDRLRT